jgi:hypothetical protein
VVCSLSVGFGSIAPAANAESLKPGKGAMNKFIESGRHFRSAWIHLPIGPTSVYHDYPYYYSRGYYPTHVGGYVYYPYHHYRERARRH